MSAIAGLVEWIDTSDPTPGCSAMIGALAPFGRLLQTSERLGQCCLGEALSADDYAGRRALEPRLVEERRLLMAADARIDNRDELIEALGIDATLGDGELLMRCWERWASAALPRILGDFAFALWDNERQSLSLARSPATTRALFYHVDANRAAFASIPQALHRLDGLPKALNLDELARRLSGGAYFGNTETLFIEIESVDPGTLVRIDRRGVRIERWWDPSMIATVRRPPDEAALILRREFERSVAACLRDASEPIASHLSGGRDSGAVTAVAAQLLNKRGGRLTAYTAAPRLGFPAGEGRYLHDESAQAAVLAGGAANIDHVVSRSEPIALCAALDQASAVHYGPMGNPANMAYWMRIMAQAEAAGSSVLLTGANGNFSISIGGLGTLPDVVSEQGVLGWWPLARRLASAGLASWRTLLNQSFGHRIPRSVHQFLRHRLIGAPGQDGYPLFRPALRQRVEQFSQVADTRPHQSYRARVREIYRIVDHADKVGLALHGIDLRDPTADRQLIEFCLSLPADQIVGSHGQRPIYDLAFADVVPAAVRSSPLKGFQGADWFEIYDPEEIRTGLRRYAGNRLVRDLIEIDAAERLLDAWPAKRGYDMATYSLYANHLLVAVALASWIDVHFPEQRT